MKALRFLLFMFVVAILGLGLVYEVTRWVVKVPRSITPLEAPRITH